MIDLIFLMDCILKKHILYFKKAWHYYLKKHGENINNPSIKICANTIENKTTLKIKNRYNLEISTPETMKLLGSSRNKVTKDKSGEIVPHLEITEVVLVHCNVVINDYQEESRFLCTFVSNKPIGGLLEISSTNNIFLKTINLEIQTIEVWFTGQNSQPLEIEDRINTTFVIK